VLRIDERVARSLTLLRSEEFAPLLEYLGNCKADSLEKMAVASEQPQIYRLQGEVGVIKEFLDLVGRSGELIEKLRR